MSSASPPVSVPRIATDRLLLRELRQADFDAFAAHRADPEEQAHLGVGFSTPRAAWHLFAAHMGVWMLTGTGWWGIELRETAELVGTVGAFFRVPALSPEPANEIEIGWTVFRAFRRRRIATEAAAAALAYGLDKHPVARAVAHIAADNAPSIGVGRAIGMRPDGVVDFYGSPCPRYVVDAPRR